LNQNHRSLHGISIIVAAIKLTSTATQPNT
jgi:hypothetical protein